MAFRLGIILLVAFATISGSSWTNFAQGAVAAENRQIGLDIKGSPTEGAKLSVLVTGVPAPGPNGETDDVLVFLKINGVTIEVPGLEWDDDEFGWRCRCHLPLGSAGSSGSITVIGGDGATLTRSFSVGP